MLMNHARLLIVVLGILMPYLARLPGGMEWLRQYTDSDLGGFLLLGGCNAIAWLSMLAISLSYRRPVSLLAPCLPGFGLLVWLHASLDLAADAQAAIALIFIPVFALVPIAIGGLVGYLVDRRLRSAKA